MEIAESGPQRYHQLSIMSKVRLIFIYQKSNLKYMSIARQSKDYNTNIHTRGQSAFGFDLSTRRRKTKRTRRSCTEDARLRDQGKSTAHYKCQGVCIYTLHMQKFLLPTPRLPKHLRSLRQSILVSGLGLEQFEQYTKAIMSIRQVLDGHLAAGMLQEWTPSTENGYLCLDFSNRYFSTNEEADGRSTFPLSKDLDPFGILAKAAGKGVHTEDNTVMYFERRSFNKAG